MSATFAELWNGIAPIGRPGICATGPCVEKTRRLLARGGFRGAKSDDD